MKTPSLHFAAFAPEDASTLPAPQLCTVDEVMTRDVVSVRPDTSVETLAELMLERNISGLPVVDAEGRLVGLVSKTDLVRAQNAPDDGSVSLPRGVHEVSGATVADLMSPRVLCVRTGAQLSEAARLMVDAGVHRLPVISRGGALQGMVSTSDVVRWVAGLP
jgi:CBS domain-containing protein